MFWKEIDAFFIILEFFFLYFIFFSRKNESIKTCLLSIMNKVDKNIANAIANNNK